MNTPRYRPLFVLLCVFLLCSTVQATDLQITVRDNIDNTTIPQATVFVNGANYARTNNYGQVFLSHAGTDDQLIRVVMSGYDDWEQTVLSNLTDLNVNLTRSTLSLTVNLIDIDSFSPVSGAKVNISAVNIAEGKLSDAAGTAIFAVKANYIYTIDIDAADYRPHSVTLDIGTENKAVQYELVSGNRFSISVKDKETNLPLADAEVRIDGTTAGKTDSRGILITPVTRGRVYTFEITAPGYETVTESKTLTESDAIYSVELSRAAIGAFIYIFDEKKSPLEGADIYFNGTLTGTSNEYGRSNFPSIVSGSYLVEVRKDGYTPESRTIIISEESEDYIFNLAFESASLSVFVQERDQKILPNATVSINGVSAGRTDERGQLVTPVKFNTPLNITVSKEGYNTASVEDEVIQGNATASVNITLEKNLDLGLLVMIGAGAVVVLVLIAAIRKMGGRKRRHILRRDEI